MWAKPTLSNLTEISKKISKGCLSLIDSISKQKLKVALISYYYQKPIVSGVGVHVLNLAKYLVKHNCEVHIFCHGDTDNYYKENGAYVHVIGRVLTPVDDSFSWKIITISSANASGSIFIPSISSISSPCI